MGLRLRDVWKPVGNQALLVSGCSIYAVHRKHFLASMQAIFHLCCKYSSNSCAYRLCWN